MPPEHTPLENLQESLYSAKKPGTAPVDTYRREVPQPAYGWTPPPAPPPSPPKKKLSWATWFLLVAILFFTIAGSVAGYLIYEGKRAISSDRVSITFTPETAIASGDIVPMVFTIKNTNPTEIFDATLYVTLPDGSRDTAGANPLPEQYPISMGTVGSGEMVTRSLSAQVFGSQGQKLTIPVRMEYRTPGSNAILISRQEFSLGVSSSPIGVSVSSAAQSASGQALTLTITVRSNASTDVKNVAVKAAFPPGFTFGSADPVPSAGGFFALGDLPAGAIKQIRVTGVLRGETGEEKVFRFSAGSKNPDGTSTLAASFAEGSASVRLIKPTLAVSTTINREVADPVTVPAGQTVPVTVRWENTGINPIQDARIEVTLAGTGIDAAGTNGGNGFYRSSDATLVFSKDTLAALGTIKPGDSGTGSFVIRTKQSGSLAGVAQPTITLTLRTSGAPAGQARVALSPDSTRTIRIATAVALSATGTRTAGPVPTPGVESTYAVTLAAANTLNSVGGARLTTTLPQYVRYAGALSGAPILYDENSRTVSWNVGDLIPNAKTSASFAIVFTPSASQSGTSPVLIGEQAFTGFDRATSQSIAATGRPLTSDATFDGASGTVR